MNVFISHKKEDDRIASAVADRLRRKQVSFYLDTFDPLALSRGDELGEHLRRVMGACTHLMAVVTQQTKDSWWVPWEIGIATEKDFPISTYAGEQCELPTYLKKWPYLPRLDDVDVWTDASRSAEQQVVRTKTLQESGAQLRARSTREFYAQVRRALRQ
jgi:hypothetical protein